jgi:hypothetical protein
MYHDLPRTARFWWFLFAIDQDLANAIRKNGCPCGGRLHSADYLRSPCGGPAPLPECLRIKLSFCCDRDGCRKRATPPSVRFLGWKVNRGAIVILISAMRQGPSPRRVRGLSARFGVDWQTIARWQVFWRERFPQSPLWRIEGARFKVTVEMIGLPYSLLNAFLTRHHRCRGWTHERCPTAPIKTGNRRHSGGRSRGGS